jgi:hypothetical protein
MTEEAEASEVDLAAALGVDGGVSAQCLSIYIPERDANGKKIRGQRKWIDEALS